MDAHETPRAPATASFAAHHLRFDTSHDDHVAARLTRAARRRRAQAALAAAAQPAADSRLVTSTFLTRDRPLWAVQRLVDAPALFTLLLMLTVISGGFFLIERPEPRRAQPSALHAWTAHRSTAVDSPDVMKRWPMSRVRATVDAPDGPWREAAVLELGRRGAIDELLALRFHAARDVRATVPLAVLRTPRRAHRLIPELADGLASPDPAVRQNTALALRSLVAELGPYHQPLTLADQPPRGAHSR